ncbi:MAG: hypothetical protein ACP5KB_02815 [Thermoprotei archaeon]
MLLVKILSMRKQFPETSGHQQIYEGTSLTDNLIKHKATKQKQPSTTTKSVIAQ